MGRQKKVYVSVTNDLSTDQRVDKVCRTLMDLNLDVTLVGRKLPGSLPLDRPYKTHRMKLIFKKGAKFYAFYNIRLFFYLLFRKVDVLHANDLDTLMANRFISIIKGCELVYDSHEYFTGVPELLSREKVRKIWQGIEKRIVPKLKNMFTVNDSIATLYKDDYGVHFKVVRNVPFLEEIKKTKSRKELGLPEDKKLIILQGSGINVDRGSEELVESMRYVKTANLVIVGGGDVIEDLKIRVAKWELEDKVFFIEKCSYNEMMQFTMNAELGVTLDKDTNINYRFSLPNKIFDYIKAGVPVLATDLVEVRRIIDSYGIGVITTTLEPKELAIQIDAFLSDEERCQSAHANMKKAITELNWEKESEVIKEIYRDIISK